MGISGRTVRHGKNTVEGSRSIHDLQTPIYFSFPLPLASTIFWRVVEQTWVSLSAIATSSVMIFPNHTLPHSEQPCGQV